MTLELNDADLELVSGAGSSFAYAFASTSQRTVVENGIVQSHINISDLVEDSVSGALARAGLGTHCHSSRHHHSCHHHR